MIPTSSAFVLASLAISLLCWGTWANTQKAAGKWRFELYYLDFALGTLLAALLGAFTLGSMGDGLSFEDNLAITGKRQMALATVSGVIFNLGNMLLAASVSMAGLAVGFPLAVGVAMIVSVSWVLVASPAGSVGLQAGGLGVIFASVILVSLAQRGQRLEARVGKRPDSGLKATLLAVFGGILLGLYQPTLSQSRTGDLGLAAYGATLFFSVGVVLSTLLFSLYFMNLPVQGEAVPLRHYWKKPHGQHVWGLAGGALWAFGALAWAIAGSAAPQFQAGPAVTLAIQYGSGLLAALCGLLIWKEFAAASGAVRMRLILGLVLFLGGVLLTAFGRQAA
jgi:glucose uptake protein